MSKLLLRALVGEPRPVGRGRRAELLWFCRRTRAHRAWIKVGCYTWLRYSDELKEWQGDLLELRRRRRAAPGPGQSCG